MNPETYVLSSRVRLARNIKGIVFPNHMTHRDADKVIDEVVRAVSQGNKGMKDQFELRRMSQTDEFEKRRLLEQHLISKELLRSPLGALYSQKNGPVSIMINEEDHLRIQGIRKGYHLDEAYEDCSLIDALLEEKIRFSFSKKYGYLTACPTNLGTGMRCSLLLHLPALSELSYMPKLIEALSKQGFTVRGLYGEGSHAQGNLFQLSNQVTMGHSEKELIRRLKLIVRDVLEKEENVEQYLKHTGGSSFIDRIGRSSGALKYSYTMSQKEAMGLLSDIKLGYNLGWFQGVSEEDIKTALLEVGDSSLMRKDGRITIDEMRSRYLRDLFKNMELEVREMKK